MPQPADPDVPVGKDDTENVEVRREGEVRPFDFEPKDHVQLGLALDMIDIERGVKLAGTRNYFLKGDGALLHWAVLRFAIDFMVQRGYTPMVVPLLMRDEAMRGTGYYPGSEEQTYRMERDELNLVGTAEVPLTAYRMGEILSGGRTAAQDRGPLQLFPPRGRGRRQGHLRALPHPPVRQGRAGRDLPQRRRGEQQVPRGDPGQLPRA